MNLSRYSHKLVFSKHLISLTLLLAIEIVYFLLPLSPIDPFILFPLLSILIWKLKISCKIMISPLVFNKILTLSLQLLLSQNLYAYNEDSRIFTHTKWEKTLYQTNSWLPLLSKYTTLTRILSSPNYFLAFSHSFFATIS